jgi:hypothetical protein
MKWSSLLGFPLSAVSLVLVASCGSSPAGVTGGGTFADGGSEGGSPSRTDGSLGGGHGKDGGDSGKGGGMTLGGTDSGSGGFGQCVPKTCTELSANCGPMGDGCGGVIQCGNCQAPETCGGGGKLSNCGGNNSCVPKTCADWGENCGPASDGCGGEIQCGICTAPATCGGGGTASSCGGTSGCVPTTCAAKGVNCGPIGDGCGGVLQCGGCGTPETCGGGGKPSVCGDGLKADAGDAGSTCVPKSCGGGGTPSVCGGTSACVPKTCAGLGLGCGPAGDGCGGEIQCGTCTAPQTCGGGATPGKCGGNNDCVPTTCAALGFNCGPAGDGCGGVLECGSTCPTGEICGGGGKPDVCGPTTTTCTGLCTQQTSCPGSGITTTLTGTVYAPNGTDPLYDALVYVPNGGASPTYGVTAFAAGVHCGQCGSEVSGTPLVSTTTAPDGTFQLQNVPVGANIPLVIQLGRWRRMISIPTVASCTNTALTALQTRMPTKEAEFNTFDNIPLMAFATGAVDGLECVLRKIGVADTQFSDPATQGGTGRIRFYKGEGAAGAQISANTPSATQLWSGTTPDIDQYDMVYFPCQGGEYVKTSAEQTVVVNYASAGGRVFGTHFSYVWFINPTPVGTTNPFLATADWAPNGTQPTPDPQTGYINTTFARGQALAQWLQTTGASTTYAQMAVNTLRHDFTNVVAPSDLWVSLGAAPPAAFTDPMHYTFDTPVGTPAASQCGRALFDDFHVEDDSATPTTGKTFPAECPATAMSAQEKMLEFMIFDLASCITPTVVIPPSCAPVTCAQQGFNCGLAGDGCGNELNCGPCTAPETCGGGGVPGQCGGTACNPISCATQGIQCGPTGDGCGDLLQCGNCPNGETCGGGGVPGKCGAPACTAITCASQGIQCGPAGNGCGGLLACGTCPPGEACGSGGQPGKCGAPDASTCTALTCAEQSISCGPAGNGCGGQLDCGPCPTGETCGGGGVPGVCGAPSCTPTTCAAQGLQCGPAGNGCGGVLQCGPCPANETCGGGGTPGVCGSSCKPTTCAALKQACGPAGDGCGGLLQCGTCTAPDTCGGGGTPGQCGEMISK